MKTVTIDDIMSWHPCSEYSRERIDELMDGRASISALNIMDLDIAPADRQWAVLREPFLDNSDLYFLASAFAERKLRIWERAYPNDLRPRHAIRAARLYAMGEIGLDELLAAQAAARAAAHTATQGSAQGTTHTATWAAEAAACATAWGAAQGSARSVAEATTWASIRAIRGVAEATTWDAEQEKQIEIIRLFILQKESKIEKVKKTKKTS